MSDLEAFDWVVGKVPKSNSTGAEHSVDYLGTGGRRRRNGEISSLVYDLQAISLDEANRLQREEPPGGLPGRDAAQAAAFLVGGAAAAFVAVYAVRNRDQLAEQVSSRILKPLKKRLRLPRQRDELAPAPESRQIAAPVEVPAELQEIVDRVAERRPRPRPGG